MCIFVDLFTTICSSTSGKSYLNREGINYALRRYQKAKQKANSKGISSFHVKASCDLRKTAIRV